MVIESDVVILSKTRMSGSNVCVGGYDTSKHRMIRLLDSHAKSLNANYPYEVGQAYRINYQTRYIISPPHTEDVAVYNYQFIDWCNIDYFNQLTLSLSLKNVNLSDLFDGNLNWENDSGYISEEKNVNYSVQIATLNNNLKKENDYFVDSTNIFSRKRVKYVGFKSINEMPDTIPAGTKIRFSLARIWDKNNDGNRRSYLQLSGIY